MVPLACFHVPRGWQTLQKEKCLSVFTNIQMSQSCVAGAWQIKHKEMYLRIKLPFVCIVLSTKKIHDVCIFPSCAQPQLACPYLTINHTTGHTINSTFLWGGRAFTFFSLCMTGPTWSGIIAGSVSSRGEWCELPRRPACVYLFACLWICVYVYKYVCVHRRGICVCVYRCEYVCMCIHMCVLAVYTCAYIHMCIHVCVQVYGMCMCVSVCVWYVCVCAYMCVCETQLTAEITFSSFATREKFNWTIMSF